MGLGDYYCCYYYYYCYYYDYYYEVARQLLEVLLRGDATCGEEAVQRCRHAGRGRLSSPAQALGSAQALGTCVGVGPARRLGGAVAGEVGPHLS